MQPWWPPACAFAHRHDFACICAGVVPLTFFSVAGVAARQSIGTEVFGGMLAATLIASLFVPLFSKWLERGKQPHPGG